MSEFALTPAERSLLDGLQALRVRYLIVGGGIPGKSGLTVTFDITTGTRLLTVAKEFDSVLAADIRPGCDIVATGGPSRLLTIWNTETGALLLNVVASDFGGVQCCAISPDGSWLISSAFVGAVTMRDARDGSVLAECYGDEDT